MSIEFLKFVNYFKKMVKLMKEKLVIQFLKKFVTKLEINYFEIEKILIIMRVKVMKKKKIMRVENNKKKVRFMKIN